MRSAKVLRLIRRLASQHKSSVVLMAGRGKGSHQMYQLISSDGVEVARFGLTDHPRDLSWTVLTRLEERLAPIFGDKWTEKR
jgi:hypothetical protein